MQLHLKKDIEDEVFIQQCSVICRLSHRMHLDSSQCLADNIPVVCQTNQTPVVRIELRQITVSLCSPMILLFVASLKPCKRDYTMCRSKQLWRCLLIACNLGRYLGSDLFFCFVCYECLQHGNDIVHFCNYYCILPQIL